MLVIVNCVDWVLFETDLSTVRMVVEPGYVEKIVVDVEVSISVVNVDLDVWQVMLILVIVVIVVDLDILDLI